MSLTLKIVSRQFQLLGKDRVMTFGQDGGTIGRSVEADWSLPDAKRFLSSRHASIDFRSGSYYIIDTSKNGVFINDAEEPVGRGKPQRLFQGDRIRIAEYEISVAIENVEDTRETLLSTSHVDPVDARQHVDAPDPTSYDLVDAHAITGVGIDMYLEDDDSESLKPIYDKYRGGTSSNQHNAMMDTVPQSQNQRPRPAVAAVKPLNRTQAPGTTSLAPFFRGAGLDAPELTSGQVDALLSQLGQVMRELIVGVIESLHLRALQKAQLKQANTIIEPRENNRLKFSANFEEGFSRLFFDDSDDYTGPVESVRGAFADIKAHQRGLLQATREALNEYLGQLEPQQLELRASNGRKGTLINAANRLKYWELYKEVYSILANGPAGELPQPFLDAFANAYRESTTDNEEDPASRGQLEAS